MLDFEEREDEPPMNPVIDLTSEDSSKLALVSCLGQGPCFSKITYMVTACKYSEGMYSTVVYCTFFDFP